MKAISRIIMALVCIFAMASCGTKYDQSKVDALTEKYSTAEGLSKGEYKELFAQYKALVKTRVMPGWDKEFAAYREGDYDKAQKARDSYSEDYYTMKKLSLMLYYAAVEGKMDESTVKAYEAFEQEKENYLSNLRQ